MTAILAAALLTINVAVILYFLVLNLGYLILSSVAFGSLQRYAMRIKTFDLEERLLSTGSPPITILAPSYNEAKTCVHSMRALLALKYPSYEIILINDGSTDDTLVKLTDAFALSPAPRLPTADLPVAPIAMVYRSDIYPNLWVVDKANGGKADALNAGLNYCETPLFCAVDADSLLERDALARIVRPFLEDDTTVAAGGIVRIANGCRVDAGVVTEVGLPRTLLGRLQVVEYLRAFLAGRMAWGSLNATLIISGAFGLFRRSAVVGAGGYATARTSAATVGEDMELVVRLRRYCRDRGIPGRVSFIPDPVAWTECPESIRVLSRQRDRWQRGLVESLWRHRGMLGRPKYGAVGLVAFPFFFFLEMVGPAIEVLGYVAFAVTVALGLASPLYVATFFAVAVVFGLTLSVAAVALEEMTFRRYPRVQDLFWLLVLAIIENFGYRQASTIWRFRGLIAALRGKHAWGVMERTGFGVGPR